MEMMDKCEVQHVKPNYCKIVAKFRLENGGVVKAKTLTLKGFSIFLKNGYNYN